MSFLTSRRTIVELGAQLQSMLFQIPAFPDLPRNSESSPAGLDLRNSRIMTLNQPKLRQDILPLREITADGPNKRQVRVDIRRLCELRRDSILVGQMAEANIPSPTRSVVTKAESRISKGKRWLYISSDFFSYMQERGDWEIFM